MNERYGNFLGSCRGEYMTTDLEKGKGHGCSYDIPAGISNAVPQSGYSDFKTRE